MVSAQLIQVAVFLAAAAIAAPLGRFFRMGAVLGYLAAGVIIGPYILGPLYQLDSVESILHFGEFGNAWVAWLYFLLGLGGAFLFWSGNLLWVESRRKRRGGEQEGRQHQLALGDDADVGAEPFNDLEHVRGQKHRGAARDHLPKRVAQDA